jgi:hypothetical protein
LRRCCRTASGCCGDCAVTDHPGAGQGSSDRPPHSVTIISKVMPREPRGPAATSTIQQACQNRDGHGAVETDRQWLCVRTDRPCPQSHAGPGTPELCPDHLSPGRDRIIASTSRIPEPQPRVVAIMVIRLGDATTCSTASSGGVRDRMRFDNGTQRLQTVLMGATPHLRHYGTQSHEGPKSPAGPISTRQD